jgi:S1-C subfamily serine protease
MARTKIWSLTVAFLWLAPAFALAQRPTPTDNDQIVEQAVPPVDRPNQIAVRELAARLGLELRSAAGGKVLVAAVHPESPAAALDIRAGDVLMSIERQAITPQVAAVNIIAADNPEKKIALTFARDGKPIALTADFPDRVRVVGPAAAAAISPRTAKVAFFGITAVENSQGQVVVAGVTPGSAAALAGVSPDDVLLQVDDADVTSLERFAAVASTLTRAKMPSDKVTIDALRKGSDQSFVLILRETDFVAVRAPLPVVVEPSRVVVEPAPVVVEPAPVVVEPARVAVEPTPVVVATAANEQIVFCMKVRRLASGSLVVTDVMAGSPAELAGIRAGDAIVSVDGEKIDSLAELAETISLQKEGDVVEFGVVRADKLGTLQVKMLPCEYKPAVAVVEPAPAETTTVDELSAQVRMLQADLEELAESVKTLTTAVRALQNP